MLVGEQFAFAARIESLIEMWSRRSCLRGGSALPSGHPALLVPLTSPFCTEVKCSSGKQTWACRSCFRCLWACVVYKMVSKLLDSKTCFSVSFPSGLALLLALRSSHSGLLRLLKTHFVLSSFSHRPFPHPPNQVMSARPGSGIRSGVLNKTDTTVLTLGLSFSLHMAYSCPHPFRLSFGACPSIAKQICPLCWPGTFLHFCYSISPLHSSGYSLPTVCRSYAKS